MSNGTQTVEITASVTDASTGAAIADATFISWSVNEEYEPGLYLISADAAGFQPGGQYFIMCLAPGYNSEPVSWQPGQALVEFQLRKIVVTGNPTGTFTQLLQTQGEIGQSTWQALASFQLVASPGSDATLANEAQIDFGDATSTTVALVNGAASLSHRYPVKPVQSYTAQATISDTDGKTATLRTNVTAGITLTPPQFTVLRNSLASVGIVAAPDYETMWVEVEILQTNFESSITNVQWNWGDGTPAFTSSPTPSDSTGTVYGGFHNYRANTKPTIAITATDNYGASSTLSIPITVPPLPDFGPAPALGPAESLRALIARIAGPRPPL